MTTPLVSLDDVRSQLPIRSGNTDHDERLEQIIAAVSLTVESFCRRTFAKKTYAEIHHVQAEPQVVMDLHGGDHTGYHLAPSGVPFQLQGGPLESDAVQVYYDLTHRFGPGTQLSADEITVIPERGTVYINRPLRRSEDSVKFVYVAGYEPTGEPPNLSESIPADLKLGVVAQCVYLFHRLEPSTMADGDLGKAKIAQLARGGLLPDVQHAIAPYRRLLRGRG